MLQFTGFELWDDSATAWSDLLFNVQDATDTAVSIIGQTADRVYIGLDRRYDGTLFVMDTAGSYTGVTYQYYNGTGSNNSWRNLPLRQTYGLTGNGGVIRFQMPSDWALTLLTVATTGEANVTGIAADDTTGGTTKYWIRINVTGVSTTATLSRSIPFPEYSYTSPTIMQRFMQLPSTFFTSSTTPSTQDVIDLIHNNESVLDKMTWKSWKPNHNPASQSESGELFEFSRFGIALENYPVIHLIDVAIFNGSEFESLTEGRNQDFFIDNEIGFIAFTRLLHLPFTYTRSAIYTWGFGEFKRAVRVTYIWGRDLEFDRTGPLVTRICNQLTAIDLIRSSDYSSFITEGPDKVSLERKADMWEEDAYRAMDELRGLRLWVP